MSPSKIWPLVSWKELLGFAGFVKMTLNSSAKTGAEVSEIWALLSSNWEALEQPQDVEKMFWKPLTS